MKKNISISDEKFKKGGFVININICKSEKNEWVFKEN